MNKKVILTIFIVFLMIIIFSFIAEITHPKENAKEEINNPINSVAEDRFQSSIEDVKTIKLYEFYHAKVEQKDGKNVFEVDVKNISLNDAEEMDITITFLDDNGKIVEQKQCSIPKIEKDKTGHIAVNINTNSRKIHDYSIENNH